MAGRFDDLRAPVVNTLIQHRFDDLRALPPSVAAATIGQPATTPTLVPANLANLSLPVSRPRIERPLGARELVAELEQAGLQLGQGVPGRVARAGLTGFIGARQLAGLVLESFPGIQYLPRLGAAYFGPLTAALAGEGVQPGETSGLRAVRQAAAGAARAGIESLTGTRPLAESDFFSAMTEAEGLVGTRGRGGVAADMVRAVVSGAGTIALEPLLAVRVGSVGIPRYRFGRPLEAAGEVTAIPGLVRKAQSIQTGTGVHVGQFTLPGTAAVVGKAGEILERAGAYVPRALLEQEPTRTLRKTERSAVGQAKQAVVEPGIEASERVFRKIQNEALRIASEKENPLTMWQDFVARVRVTLPGANAAFKERVQAVFDDLSQKMIARMEEAQKAGAIREVTEAAFNTQVAQLKATTLDMQRGLLQTVLDDPTKAGEVLARAAKQERARVKSAKALARDRGKVTIPAVEQAFQDLGGHYLTRDFRAAVLKLKEIPQLAGDVERAGAVREAFQPFAKVDPVVKAAREFTGEAPVVGKPAVGLGIKPGTAAKIVPAGSPVEYQGVYGVGNIGKGLHDYGEFVPSHVVDPRAGRLVPNPEYPTSFLQPRNSYETVERAEQLRLESTPANFRPENLLSDTIQTVDGPMQVARDPRTGKLVILSGNSRFLRLKFAQEQGAYERYISALGQHGTGIENPAVYRELGIDPLSEEAATFARLANRSPAASESAFREAASVAQLMEKDRGNILRSLDVEDRTVLELLADPRRSEPIRKSFYEALGPEAAKYFDGNALNDLGKAQVQRSLMMMVFPVEQVETMPPLVTNTLIKSLSTFLDMSAGAVPAKYNLAPVIQDAMKFAVERLDGDVRAWPAYVAQGQFFGDKAMPVPLVQDVLERLARDISRPNVFRQHMQGYIKRVRTTLEAEKAGLLGGEALNIGEVLDDVWPIKGYKSSGGFVETGAPVTTVAEPAQAAPALVAQTAVAAAPHPVVPPPARPVAAGVVPPAPVERPVINPDLIAAAKETLRARVATLQEEARSLKGSAARSALMKVRQAQASLKNVERVQAGIAQPDQYLAAVADVQKGLQRARGALQSRLHLREKGGENAVNAIAAHIAKLRTIANEEQGRLGVAVEALMEVAQPAARIQTGSPIINRLADEMEAGYQRVLEAEVPFETPQLSRVAVQRRKELGGGRAVVTTTQPSIQKAVEAVADDIALRFPHLFAQVPIGEAYRLGYAPRMVSGETLDILRTQKLKELGLLLAGEDLPERHVLGVHRAGEGPRTLGAAPITQVGHRFQKQRRLDPGTPQGEINAIMRNADDPRNPYGIAIPEYYYERPAFVLSQRFRAHAQLLSANSFVRGVRDRFGREPAEVKAFIENGYMRPLDRAKMAKSDQRLLDRVYDTDVATAIEDTYGQLLYPKSVNAVLGGIEGVSSWWKGWALANVRYIKHNAFTDIMANYFDGLNPITGLRFYHESVRMNAMRLPLDDMFRIGVDGHLGPTPDLDTMVKIKGHELGTYRQVLEEMREANAGSFYTVESVSRTESLLDQPVSTGRRVKHTLSYLAGRNNPYAQFMRSMAGDMENATRSAHYLYRRWLGDTPEQAVERVNYFHHDYHDLTVFEQGMRRYGASPFYTWLKKQTVLMSKEYVKNPGKASIGQRIIGMYESARPADTPNDWMVPDWIEDHMGVEVRWDNKSAEVEYKLFEQWVPHSEILKIGDPVRFITDFLGPIPKLGLLELPFGFNTFTLQPDKDRFVPLETGVLPPIPMTPRMRKVVSTIAPIAALDRFVQSSRISIRRGTGPASARQMIVDMWSRGQRFSRQELEQQAKIRYNAQMNEYRSDEAAALRALDELPPHDPRRVVYHFNLEYARQKQRVLNQQVRQAQ